MNNGGLTAALAGFALVVMGVLPLLVLEDTYGDVAVPGSAHLHLPAGEVDVTLRSVAATHEPSVPPLSIRISGPDGIRPAEVVENPRTTSLVAGDERVRVWVVRIAQEASYRVDIDGEVYGPYKPTLTFGHVMRNDSLHWLLTIGARLSLGVFHLLGGVVLSAVFGTVFGSLLHGRRLPSRIHRAEVAGQTVGESVNRARKFEPETTSIPCVAHRSDHWISGTTASADANERADLRGGTS